MFWETYVLIQHRVKPVPFGWLFCRWGDTDNEGSKIPWMIFPSEPTQWQDSDGDGFWDNWADGSWNATREGQLANGSPMLKSDSFSREKSGTSDNSAWGGRTEVILGFWDFDGDGWAQI
ncbi:MAG: hypothetical protein Ct9H90mP16_07770 [Candidatus Poseidoniales archaeon]|nr:MAG: hypothetical protein Ct9H90mP16_07770 [Candidatus Poseidoniales archaeon]